MIGVGFEPTPPKRLVPKTSALDRSAIQPETLGRRRWHTDVAIAEHKNFQKIFPNRDSNPGRVGENHIS